jgi:hypothetical protein
MSSYMYLCANLTKYLSEREMFQTNFASKDKKLYILFNFSVSLNFYEIITQKGIYECIFELLHPTINMAPCTQSQLRKKTEERLC